MNTFLRTLLLVTLLPALAACGAKGAAVTVKVDPDHEAVIAFQGKKTFGVTVSNEGPSPIQVLWPTRMLDITLPPGSDSGQTISADVPIRITCKAAEGASVRLSSPGAAGVRVQGAEPQ